MMETWILDEIIKDSCFSLGHLRGQQLQRGSEHAEAGVQGERDLPGGRPWPIHQGNLFIKDFCNGCAHWFILDIKSDL